MAGRESDQLVVLGGRESRPHGEGVDGNTQLAKETHTGLSDQKICANLTVRNSKEFNSLNSCEASIIEEPCAIVSHAGICAGAAGQLAVLPR